MYISLQEHEMNQKRLIKELIKEFIHTKTTHIQTKLKDIHHSD